MFDDERKIREVEDAIDGKHRKWIEEFAANIGQTSDTLMEFAKEYLLRGETVEDPSPFNSAAWSAGWDEFWEHYQALTGYKLNGKDPEFFVCNC